MAPGSPVTFSGTATDDEGLDYVSITLRNSTTQGEPRVRRHVGHRLGRRELPDLAAQRLAGTTYNWSYTTPFNLRPGTYSFSVSATDDLGLTTSSANRGSLTINVQVPGDAFPDGTAQRHRHPAQPAGPAPGPGRHGDGRHRCLGGPADDPGQRHQPLPPAQRHPGRRVRARSTRPWPTPTPPSTTWTLSVNLPTQGDYSVTAFAYDTSGQQDPSTVGRDGSVPGVPG